MYAGLGANTKKNEKDFFSVSFPSPVFTGELARGFPKGITIPTSLCHYC